MKVVPYEIAVLLKEKGISFPKSFAYQIEEGNRLIEFIYTLPTFNLTPHFLQAPFYQQVVDWFREEHNCYIQVAFPTHAIQIWYDGKWHLPTEFNLPYYKAFDKGIIEALKLIP